MPQKPPIHGAKQRQAQAKRAARAYDERRGSVTQRGYGHEWRVGLREQTLDEEPLCRECLAKGKITRSTVADHIIPRSQGGANDLSNTQGLCDTCHNRKRQAEMIETRRLTGKPQCHKVDDVKKPDSGEGGVKKSTG